MAKGIEDCRNVYVNLILLMLEQIQTLQEKCDRLEEHICALLKQFDNHSYHPGISPILVAIILSEIGDISRFPSADKLAAYFGVDPSVNRSGDFVGTNVHMSKRALPICTEQFSLRQSLPCSVLQCSGLTTRKKLPKACAI